MISNRERHQKELDMYGYTVFKSTVEARIVGKLQARELIDDKEFIDCVIAGTATIESLKDAVDIEINNNLKEMFNEAMGDYYDE